MFDWIHDLLYPIENPGVIQSLIVIMLAIGTGVFVGRIRIGKISLGVAAIMFTGLLLGHLGYRIETNILNFIRDLGLIFFVYGIGLQVGPSFFSSFRAEGLRFNLLAVGMVLLGGVMAYLVFRFTGLPMENVVGIMSGAVTNTPGLGAAKSVLAEIGQQYPGKVLSDPAIGYAITYPLGVFGIIVSIIGAKVLLRVDADRELKKFRMMRINREEPLVHKKCRITNKDYAGQSLHQVLKSVDKEVVISRMKHSGYQYVFSPTMDTHLQWNDVLMVVGLEKDVDAFIQAVGRVSNDSFIESSTGLISKTLFVTRKSAMHKKLSELDLYNTYDLKVTRIYRAGREILARPSLVLFFGDRLRVVGSPEAIEEAEKIIGNSEKKLLEPDFLSLFGGLLLGIVLGSIPILIPSLPVPIRLGFAAGPLIMALFVSRYGGISFIHSYINTGAIHFMKDLGISLFFAAVGVHAGEHFYEYFVQYNGWMWLVYGSVITFVPLILMVLVGGFLMKLNFLQLAGIMSGGYTDPAALSFSTAYLNTDVPVAAYAQVYPLVTIFRIFVAQLLILLFT